jgi:hypothetical protein
MERSIGAVNVTGRGIQNHKKKTNKDKEGRARAGVGPVGREHQMVFCGWGLDICFVWGYVR